MISTIRQGDDYIYTRGFPVRCHGHRYRVLRFLEDVPSYQQKVLVEALTGPDTGKWFTCSLANFARRYEPVPPPKPEPARKPDPLPPERKAGRRMACSGV